MPFEEWGEKHFGVVRDIRQSNVLKELGLEEGIDALLNYLDEKDYIFIHQPHEDPFAKKSLRLGNLYMPYKVRGGFEISGITFGPWGPIFHLHFFERVATQDSEYCDYICGYDETHFMYIDEIGEIVQYDKVDDTGWEPTPRDYKEERS